MGEDIQRWHNHAYRISKEIPSWRTLTPLHCSGPLGSNLDLSFIQALFQDLHGSVAQGIERGKPRSHSTRDTLCSLSIANVSSGQTPQWIHKAWNILFACLFVFIFPLQDTSYSHRYNKEDLLEELVYLTWIFNPVWFLFLYRDFTNLKYGTLRLPSVFSFQWLLWIVILAAIMNAHLFQFLKHNSRNFNDRTWQILKLNVHWYRDWVIFLILYLTPGHH